jgi:hypothetical protein
VSGRLDRMSNFSKSVVFDKSVKNVTSWEMVEREK